MKEQLESWIEEEKERRKIVSEKIEARRKGRSESVVLPAGTYIVGDPCYCFENHDSWSHICDQLFEDSYKDESLSYGSARFCQLNGKNLVCVTTMYGDGTYLDQYDKAYGVDAGLLGAVPIELVEDGCSYLRWKKEDGENNDCGRIFAFNEPFECYYDAGKVVIGHLKIETDYEKMYPEEFEDEDDE